jgi:hypothetical protein
MWNENKFYAIISEKYDSVNCVTSSDGGKHYFLAYLKEFAVAMVGSLSENYFFIDIS